MANVAKRAAARFGELLRAPGGLSENLAAVWEVEAAAGEAAMPEIVETNVAAEIREKALAARYPAVHVYCARLENSLREKFRTFSGTARIVAEIRVSQDRIEGIEQSLQLYTDALTRVLDQRRGDWGGGLFYTGGYTVEFGAVKRGGKNLMQTASVTFDVHGGVD